MIPDPVTVPLWLDLPAVVISALGGALVASRAGFDLSGVFGLGLLTGLGGGILRDLLLNQVPVALETPEYIIAAVLASALIAVSARSVDRFIALVIVLDAAALGLYGVTGINKTLAFGFDAWSAVLVGMVAALGGGVLRDIATAKSPEIFRKGARCLPACLVVVQRRSHRSGSRSDRHLRRPGCRLAVQPGFAGAPAGSRCRQPRRPESSGRAA